MKTETQQLYLEKMLSSNELFSRCINILSPDYFDLELKQTVKFIIEYYNNYNSIPKIDFINAEFDQEFEIKSVEPTEHKFLCDSIETFCKREALFKSIKDSIEDIADEKNDNFGKILNRIENALAISIHRELGIDVFKDVKARLETYLVSDVYESTGIKGLDDALGGGLSRKTLTMFSANSGGGKSLMMANIGTNYAKDGKHVLQLALELTEQMIDLRNISMFTGVDIATWKNNITEIENIMHRHVKNGAGSFVLKRIPGGSSALDIRSYLKLYEMEYKRKPDVLIVDYLDLMHPNGGNKNKNIFEQDKEKSEELVEILFEYDMIGLTASQQNREGVKSGGNPDQSIIAGGISKINTVDNYISIYMNPEMRLKGELFLYYLKTRSSKAVGTMTQLVFNPDNLIIADKKVTSIGILNQIKQRVQGERVTFDGANGETEIPEDLIDLVKEYHVSEDIIPELNTEKIDLENDEDIWKDSNVLKHISGITDDDLDEFYNF